MTRKDSLIDMDSTFEEEEQESGEDGQDENEYTVETRVVKVASYHVRHSPPYLPPSPLPHSCMWLFSPPSRLYVSVCEEPGLQPSLNS